MKMKSGARIKTAPMINQGGINAQSRPVFFF